MPTYDNFEYYKAFLLRRIKFSRDEREAQYEKLFNKAKLISKELTDKFADKGEGIIDVYIDKRHVKFSPFRWTIRAHKKLKSSITILCRAQINPCFDYPLPKKHHTKIWTIFTNETAQQLNGDQLTFVFGLCRLKAEEVGRFVKTAYVDTFSRTIEETDANFTFDIQHASLADTAENEQISQELFKQENESNYQAWSRINGSLNPILTETRNWNLSALADNHPYRQESYYQRLWNMADGAVLRVTPAENGMSISGVSKIWNDSDKKRRMHTIIHPTTQQLNLEV